MAYLLISLWISLISLWTSLTSLWNSLVSYGLPLAYLWRSIGYQCITYDLPIDFLREIIDFLKNVTDFNKAIN